MEERGYLAYRLLTPKPARDEDASAILGGVFDVVALGGLVPLGIECKSGPVPSALGVDQWNTLWYASMGYGFIPVLAYRPWEGRKRVLKYLAITGPKTPDNSRPYEPWDPPRIKKELHG